MTEQLKIVGLGGSLARNSRSLAAVPVALDGASEAEAAKTSRGGPQREQLEA